MRTGKTLKTLLSKSGAADVVFEGVVLPKGTRSAKLATMGITNEAEMGNFLTAVFADTLNGKIILPRGDAGVDGRSPILNSVEEKFRKGPSLGIRAMSTLKQPSAAKGKKS